MPAAVVLGAVAGLAWGITARLFMRLLTTDPAFTWSGTLAILLVASVVGALVGAVRSRRHSGGSPWWRLLGLPFVLLFTAAGATLLPGVAGVVAILDTRRWVRLTGVPLLGLTGYAVVADLGGRPSGAQLLGLAVLCGCLVVEGWAAREVVRRWSSEPDLDHRTAGLRAARANRVEEWSASPP